MHADELRAFDIAAIDRGATDSVRSEDSLYVIDRGPDAVLRKIRPGKAHFYLVCDEKTGRPREWNPTSVAGGSNGPVIRGKVVWLGVEKDGRK